MSFGRLSIDLLDSEEVIAQILAVFHGSPTQGRDVNDTLGLKVAPRPGCACLKVSSQLGRVDVLVPIVGAGRNDSYNGGLGDEFRGQIRHGRAGDGGPDDPAAGLEVRYGELQK